MYSSRSPWQYEQREVKITSLRHGELIARITTDEKHYPRYAAEAIQACKPDRTQTKINIKSPT